MQGAGEALAAPAALGLIALLFADPKERMKALGLWGGIAGLGGVCGTVISGALTDLASWRWIFFINLPVALVALVMVPRLVPESRMTRKHHRMDLAGAVTATCGLVAIVDGLLQAASHPWASWQVLAPLLGGAGLLGLMVVVEAQSAAPLIPPRFFTNRRRRAWPGLPGDFRAAARGRPDPPRRAGRRSGHARLRAVVPHRFPHQPSAASRGCG